MVYAFFATRIRPQKHYLPKTFFSPKNTLQSSKAPYCRWQYGLLSPYFAALNTGFCRPISLRSIRALATLLPPLGGNALRRSGYVLGLCPCAHTPTQPARIALGNTGFHRPISLRSIRALATLLPPLGGNALRRSGYVLGLCPCAHTPTQPARIALGNTGFHRPISLRSIRALATLLPLAGQCAPPLRLCARRSAACAHTPTQPARIAVGNTGQNNTIHPIHIKMII